LEIPWQYDINFIHDGRKNTYTPEKNVHIHMLLPMEDKKVKEEAIPSILLMREGTLKRSQEGTRYAV
jgi:hypothetical protein